jgi:hypothetical protein
MDMLPWGDAMGWCLTRISMSMRPSFKAHFA